jgi:hypothetical protein
MLSPTLFHFLVPDAPLHRRTDRDERPSARISDRADSEKFLKEIVVRPGLEKPTLVSSFAGAIKSILFAFPHFAVTDPELAPAYRSVIAALRHGTRFVVVHNGPDREAIAQWFASAGHPKDAVVYVALPEYVSFTDWAEDGYVAVTDANSGHAYLVEPWEFWRSGDALIADAVDDHTSVRSTQAPLIFQGGNSLVGDRFWLLGKDYFADSTSLLQRKRPPLRIPDGQTPEQFVRRLFSDYLDCQRQLIVVGTDKPIPIRSIYGTREGDRYFLDLPTEGVGTFQPIFHIDMLITLLGPLSGAQFEVMVGEPALADRQLGTRSPFALSDVYDGVARQLTDAGCKVHRNPLVHWPTPGRQQSLAELVELSNRPDNEALIPAVKELAAAGARDETRVTTRSWHHITWNNCLVENSAKHGRHVYLPTFGHGDMSRLSVIDDHMADLWKNKLGFEVHKLADFNVFARRQGVVHCIKKYLERGD